MRNLSLVFLSLALFACTDAGDHDIAVPVDTSNTFTLRATGDISSPAAMIQAAFLPNPVASMGAGFALNLPGDILLLSDNGDIWRTTTEGEKPELIAEGDFTDITGYSPDGAPGVILALTGTGSLTAFVKNEDGSEVRRLAVSQGGTAIKAFCKGVDTVIGTDGKLHKLTGAVSDNTVIEIAAQAMDSKISNASTCHGGGTLDLLVSTEKRDTQHWQLISDGDVSPVKTAKGLTSLSPLNSDTYIGLDQANGSPLIMKENAVAKLIIEDGLSIRGLDQAAFVTSTQAPMGTTFSNGLILLSDANEPRLVMISMEYAQRELTD